VALDKEIKIIAATRAGGEDGQERNDCDGMFHFS